MVSPSGAGDFKETKMKGQLPDLQAVLAAKQSLVPATRTASGNGTGVDCKDYDGQVFAVCSTGAVSGTTPTLNWTLEESTDDSTYTALALVGTAAAQVTASNNIQVLQATRTKRYVRAVATIGGTTPSFASEAFLLLQKKFG